jgi:predicted PurR-regulated permease PerM
VENKVTVRSAGVTLLVVFAGFAMCYFARDMLVPIAVAIMVYLLLSPAVRGLAKGGVPPAAGAALVLLAFVVAVVFLVYSLASPAAEWFDRMPQIARELQDKLEALRKPVEDVSRASEQVEDMADMGPDSAQEVVIRGPGLLEQVAGQVGEIAVALAVILILAYFLLASGELIRHKLVRIAPRLSDKKLSLHVAGEIETQVSRYLLIITTVNFGVGVCVGVGTAAIGMPNPLLWAVMAAFLSYIPFVGSWVGIGSLAVVALLSFDDLGHAAIAPAIYLVVHMIADNFIIPAVLGRRLTLNPVAIVLSVIVWGWLWGVPGALLAGPILITVKVLGDNIPAMATIGELLGGTAPAPTLPRQRVLSE